jgi:hypothetical protein
VDRTSEVGTGDEEAAKWLETIVSMLDDVAQAYGIENNQEEIKD